MYHRNKKGWFKHLDFMILDMVMLQVAFVLSYWIRMGFENPYGDPRYRSIAIIIEVLDIIVLLLYNTLSGTLKRRKSEEISRTVKHTVLLFALFVAYLFVAQLGAMYSRLSIGLMFVFYLILTYLVREAWKARLNHKDGSRAPRTMLIITTEDRAEITVRDIEKKEFGNVRVCGLVIMGKDMTGDIIAGVPVVANTGDADDYICREWVDEVFIRYPRGSQINWRKIRRLSLSGVIIHMKLEDGYETIGQQQIIEKLGGYTVMTATMNSMTHRQAFLKRALDILGGLVGCLITVILFIFLAPAIYIKSPGPIFFKQVRVGRNGKKFKMYKFRSMYPDADERKAEFMEQNRVKDGMMFKMDFDPRVIGNRVLPDGTQKKGIGDFIRRKSLDEFPQFFNVLKGDMSLVGTRPPTVDEWEKYELRHRARLAIKPGITGMWQVSGRSDIDDFEKVVELDVKYIHEWSLMLDIKILLKTLKQVVSGKGAM